MDSLRIENHIAFPVYDPAPRDPDDINPSCHDCGSELLDVELGHQDEGHVFCQGCWKTYPECSWCESRITGDVQIERSEYHTILRDYPKQWIRERFHEACFAEWLAMQQKEGA